MTPIGYVRSPYREKFAVPRQPGLAARVVSELRLDPPYNNPDAFRGIEQYTHLWLIFGFSLVGGDEVFRPTVRPPRLGGNSRLGVFATRSPFRPNRLGLSAVRFAGMKKNSGELSLFFAGGDLVDGTPVYDIKPYIAFSDSISDASSGFATDPPARARVEFSKESECFLSELAEGDYPCLRELVADILSYDHRPAYRSCADDGRIYGVALYDLNIRFSYGDGRVLVVSIEKLKSDQS
ncbi:MAG: tRNA (N6-threonylcarbamoyladenosine(37)-N6)-methyltransferase TrmO [Succinivibrionaceae bacterium]|nr:tRNA (N6-threonylcarbamoyladenosine(37)-N6)-methyltransferase TrmO [Succinivibrionaceae bacterium]